MNTLVGNGFELHLRWDGDVLVVQVEGPHDSFEISLAYWQMIADERARLGAKRVLVLENLKETAAEDQVVDLTEYLVKLDFKGARVAFVDAVDYHRSVQEYVAIRAREHGITAAVFGDASQAMTWLRHGEA